jgi:hypothetical protein
MRLRWIAGHGSAAAFVSAGAVAVYFAIQQVDSSGFAPAFAIATPVAYFLALWLWLIGLHLGIILVANTPVVIDVNALYLAQLLYIIWAIWLGATLRRTTAVAPAPAL